ncbi:MAG TPA: DUF177 domain-containing protein [Armatimonadota bacterium]|nr:DUF177 domain-containing protein [Armatimonadota bacterium]
MLLDISEILRVVGSSFRFELDETNLPLDGLQLASPVGGEVTVSNSGSRLLIRGLVWGDVTLQCGRCLRNFVLPLDAEIEEDFDMRQVQRLASRQKVEDETMKALFVGAAIDLNELVLQEFTLNIPINPICSLECEPPCAECGKLRSHCVCLSRTPQIDPRWQPLVEELNHTD